MRYKILLSYNGKAFNGWQIQKNAPTVQGCIQKALSTLLREEISITGAGRTDTDVHSSRYVAHFDTPSKIAWDAVSLVYKLNAILPKDIVIHQIMEVNDGFHSRFEANKREYKYFLHRKKDPFIKDFSYYYTYPLNINEMNEAAKFLLGEHNFACFEKSGGNSTTSICTIYEAKWEEYIPEHVKQLGFPCKKGDYLVFTVSANRFLRNMVRAIVGSMLEVGRGKQSAQWMKELVEKGTRSDAGESVPGNALFLCDVHYPSDDE